MAQAPTTTGHPPIASEEATMPEKPMPERAIVVSPFRIVIETDWPNDFLFV